MTKRILVVDDQTDIREIVRMSLERFAGWTVLTASDGAEAVRLARTETLDGVLLDVMMPGTDGPATVSLLRAHPRATRLPILLLTAKEMTHDDQPMTRQLDIDGVVAKPFDPLTLADTIRSLLGWEGTP
ncbi:response regulator [Streptomyces sp. NPDC094143]|uniref:response regulator n=1 Tax=Streptomyces sp. NPDC094143 TaxID=3155310 RepID=UPI00332AF60B